MPYRTGSRPFCSTNESTVSPLGPGHSWLLVCLDRSRLLLLMLPGPLLDKHKNKNHRKSEGRAAFNSLGHCRETLPQSDASRSSFILSDGAESVLKCCITCSKCAHCVCFCTWSLRRTALDFTRLSGFWLEGRVAAVAPGYQLLPLVTLHFSNLDAAPTGLTALRGHEGTGSFIISLGL